MSAQMDLTQQSVHRLISTLADDGLLLMGPLVPPVHKGKPSPQLLLNPRFGCAIGISLDTDAVGVSCMDFAGNHTSRRLIASGLSMAATFDRIEAAIDSLLADMRFARDDIIGIGFAITGFLMDGSRYNPPVPLAEWFDQELEPLVADRLGAATWSENNANAAALCEAMFGAGREFADFVYLSFNYGFGSGIIADGRLLRGGFGNAGEVSGMFDGEEKANRPALSGLLHELQSRGGAVSTIEDLARIDPSDPGLLAWLDRVSPQFNRVVNALASTVDPEAVVLGGQIPQCVADALIERTVFFGKTRHGVQRRMPALRISALGRETPAIGAACLPLRALAF